MHQLDTLVLDHPTEVLDHPTEVLDDPSTGRHRAAPSAARRTGTRMAAGAVALLVVAVLGWFTAEAVGLTKVMSSPAAEFPVGSLRPEGDEPSPARAATMTATPTPVAPPAAAVDVSGGSTAEAPTPPAVREPQMTERSPVPSVRVGDPCRSPGAVGVTSKGKQAVCTAGGGPTRWKHA